jgi:ELWxxDGT repeat protein
MVWTRLPLSWVSSLARRPAAPRRAPRRRAARPTLEALEDRCLLSAASLLKDINTDTFDSTPQQLRADGDRVFFVADDGLHGKQLWVSDGTAAGTVRLTDSGSLSPFIAPDQLTVVNHTLFFTYADALHGRELWKSDGTVTGTGLVKDINPGSQTSFPQALTAAGDTLFFAADDGVHGVELWKSDGTEAGTVLVKDVNPGPDSGLLFGGQVQMVAANGTLYFVGFTPQTGAELWKSDGTEAGTTLVTEVNPGPANGGIGQLTAGGQGVFFRAFPSAGGIALYYSDGTAAGTRQLANTAVGEIATVGPTTYFAAPSPATGYDLWKSDGTVDGTVRVKSFNAPGFNLGPLGLTAVGDTLFFAATDGVHGYELWKSDGTEAGTVLVKDVNPGPASSGLNMFTDVGGTLYFAAMGSPSSGMVLWKSDGTEQGTVKVKDVLTGTTGTGSNVPPEAVAAGGRLFFRAFDPATGLELWASDGTEAGTALVKDVNAVSKDAFSGFFQDPGFAEVNGTVYFVAFDRVNGRSLWKTDGTEAGTQLVKGVGGGTGSFFTELTPIGGTLFFRGPDFSLWKSDGTTAGTVPVAANPNRIGSPDHLINVGGTLFFFAYDPTQGYGLYKSDGTDAGTVRLKSLPGYYADSVAVGGLAALNGVLYFTTSSGLWSSDGTAEGTQLVRSFFFLRPADVRIIVYGGSLFFGFVTSSPTFHVELWKSDGTAAGTMLLQSFSRGGLGEPAEMTVSGGTLYFRAEGALWASDGTAAGTRQVRTSAGSVIGGFHLTDWNGTLYFVSGNSLWKTDGTSAGTVPITAIGSPDLFNGTLTPYDGYLYFATTDPDHGRELWRSNGTAAGTALFQDINAGPASSDPQYLTREAGRLFFTAADGLHGREVWVLTIAPTVESVVINDGSAQRSMVTSLTVTFDSVVTLDPGAFEVRRQGGGLIPLTVSAAVVGNRTVAVLTFTGADVIGGSLPDGSYTLTVRADHVHDLYGQAPLADSVTTFFRLFGDSNGNGVVDLQDLERFALTFGKSAGQPGYLADFDYYGAGHVGLADLLQLLRRLGKHE